MPSPHTFIPHLLDRQFSPRPQINSILENIDAMLAEYDIVSPASASGTNLEILEGLSEESTFRTKEKTIGTGAAGGGTNDDKTFAYPETPENGNASFVHIIRNLISDTDQTPDVANTARDIAIQHDLEASPFYLPRGTHRFHPVVWDGTNQVVLHPGGYDRVSTGNTYGTANHDILLGRDFSYIEGEITAGSGVNMMMRNEAPNAWGLLQLTPGGFAQPTFPETSNIQGTWSTSNVNYIVFRMRNGIPGGWQWTAEIYQ